MKERERVLLQGVVSEVSFPNKGKLVPTEEQPSDWKVDPPAGTLYVEPTKQYDKLNVKNLLPGQKWLVSTAKNGRYSHDGLPIRLLEKAPYEIESPCPHAGVCGGCLYLTVPYEKQLQMKQEQVGDLLHDVLENESVIWDEIVTSPMSMEYRNKMEFSFGDEFKGGPLSLGMHRRGAYHDILNTADCRLISSDARLVVEATATFFREKQIPQYNTYSREGVLRHLVIRRSFDEKKLLINLVSTSKADEEVILQWKDRVLSLSLEGEIAGILHTINDGLADMVRADSLTVLYGEPKLTEKLLGLSFDIFPFSFFQTNSLGAEKLYTKVREMAGDVSGKTVFDLYCGTGTIAQIMADAGAKEVTGIEIVEEAVDAARINATKNGLDNCKFIAGDVLKQVENLSDKPDLIVLDPPRDGIHPKAMPKLLQFAPKEFVYVSCKPTSLVRDLPAFQKEGYRVERIALVDMFPQTPNIETVVLLAKGEINS